MITRSHSNTDNLLTFLPLDVYIWLCCQNEKYKAELDQIRRDKKKEKKIKAVDQGYYPIDQLSYLSIYYLLSIIYYLLSIIYYLLSIPYIITILTS